MHSLNRKHGTNTAERFLLEWQSILAEAVVLFKEENQAETGSTDLFAILDYLVYINKFEFTPKVLLSNLTNYFTQRKVQSVFNWYCDMRTINCKLERELPEISFSKFTSVAFVNGISSKRIKEALIRHRDLELFKLWKLARYFEKVLHFSLGEYYYKTCHFKFSIETSINNIPSIAVIDTGSTINIVDQRFLQHANICHESSSLDIGCGAKHGKATMVGFCSLDTGFNGYEFKNEECLVAEEANQGLLIGNPVLSTSSRLRLDYGGSFSNLIVNRFQTLPVVRVTVNNSTTIDEALIDTGATNNWMDINIASELEIDLLQLETPGTFQLICGKQRIVSSYCYCTIAVKNNYYQKSRFFIEDKRLWSMILGQEFLQLHDAVVINYGGDRKELLFSFREPLCLRESKGSEL